MKHAELVTFGGSGLERAAHIRGDADQLAQMREHPQASCLLLWRGKPLVQGEALDRLGLIPMTHALVKDGPGGSIEEPVFLGLSDREPVFALDISNWSPDGLDMSQVEHLSTRPNNSIRTCLRAMSLPSCAGS